MDTEEYTDSRFRESKTNHVRRKLQRMIRVRERVQGTVPNTPQEAKKQAAQVEAISALERPLIRALAETDRESYLLLLGAAEALCARQIG